MGYQQGEIEIYTRLSRHNSNRDDRDNELFEDMCQRIREIINEEQYQVIEPIMNSVS